MRRQAATEGIVFYNAKLTVAFIISTTVFCDVHANPHSALQAKWTNEAVKLDFQWLIRRTWSHSLQMTS